MIIKNIIKEIDFPNHMDNKALERKIYFLGILIYTSISEVAKDMRLYISRTR